MNFQEKEREVRKEGGQEKRGKEISPVLIKCPNACSGQEGRAPGSLWVARTEAHSLLLRCALSGSWYRNQALLRCCKHLNWQFNVLSQCSPKESFQKAIWERGKPIGNFNKKGKTKLGQFSLYCHKTPLYCNIL